MNGHMELAWMKKLRAGRKESTYASDRVYAVIDHFEARVAALEAERDAAYRKGAEDMRERAAVYHDVKEDYHLEAHRFAASSHHSTLELSHHASAEAIRKLELEP